MYHEFFGLNESAFSIAVNPRYLYMSQQHQEALAHLLYGIQNGGFVMLTGEVGTGKTTLVRCLLEQLPENTDLAMILNPMASAPELLATICDELSVSYINDEITVKELTDSLNHFLLVNHARGRKSVLLIDEAQLLQVSVLEQIRLLTNLETTTDKLLQIMLIGQPELKELLAKPELRQLSQRITARFHLTALTLEDTEAYLQHRLKVAGMSESQEYPFPPDIVKLIHQQSQGIPRVINVLAERLLLGAYAQQKRQVDKATFDQAVYEVTGEKLVAKKGLAKSTKALIQGLVVMAIVLVVAWINKSDVLFNSQKNLTSVQAGVSSVSSSLSSSSSSISSSSSSSIAPISFFERYADLLMKKNSAEQLLLSFSGESTFDLQKPCAIQLGQNYQCQTEKLSTWDELRDINRPGLLTLVDDNKQAFYLLLVGLNNNELLVRDQQQEKLISWKSFAPYWNGEFTFTWKAPVGFDKELTEGDQHPVVGWVAQQFALMDQQREPLTQLLFTDSLKKRLLIFQASQGLPITGVIDKATLQKINLINAVDKQLLIVPNKISLPVQSASSSWAK
jgi:general secretion pathway protein A